MINQTREFLEAAYAYLGLKPPVRGVGVIDKSSYWAIAQSQGKYYNNKYRISPISAKPLIQSALPRPSASIAGGFFIGQQLYPRKPPQPDLFNSSLLLSLESTLLLSGIYPQKEKMSQITQLGSGAIWICNKCHTWWGSQIGKRPSTNFLTRLDKADLLPSWETYRGWKLVAEQAQDCLNCGNHVAVPALQSN